MSKEFFKYPIQKFIKNQINSGTVLLFFTIVALFFANSSLRDWYFGLLNKEVALFIGDFSVFNTHGANMTFLTLINDALMTIFFFSVGLEIKREILVGELSTIKKSLLPVIAAVGGMVIPVMLFLIIAPEGPAMNGAAIPMATDIAFSLGVLAMLGKRVPLAVKIFLTTFAVVDDIGGIIVIGLFYSNHIQLEFLYWAIIFIGALYIAGRMGLSSKLYYIVIGTIVWYLFLNSGVHATIAGVIVAFSIPARPKINLPAYIKDIEHSLERLPHESEQIMDHRSCNILANSELSVLKHIEHSSDKAISPLQSLDDNLHPVVNYLVMPIFAFANAGVSFQGFSLGALFEGVTLYVMISLVIGKFVGIFSFTWISIKTGLLNLPDKMNLKTLAGVSLLGGIGFTISLFIANLSYADVPEIGSTLLNQAKIGIIFGSLFAGIGGYLVLDKVLKKPDKEN